MQRKTPINQLEMYLDGFHYRDGDMNHQMEAHHYCEQVNNDFTQCAIYDGNTDDAKLIGVEYIVSNSLFNTLPKAEQALWHTHTHEVTSGQLIAPGIPRIAEHELMEKIYQTKGKTWHLWDSHQDKLPLGGPHLMRSFTRDGQLKPELLKARDKRFNINTQEVRDSRKDIPQAATQGSE